ncbi:TylF/MycF/NovP-related O-methyltransferase [Bosea sp. NPDC055332]
MLPKTLVKTVLRATGFAIYRIPRAASEQQAGYSYSQAHPNATLAPWLSDAEFMAAFEVAKHNTLVDIYRMYELWSLVRETAKVGGDIVEIGVWRGGSGVMMAKQETLLGGSGTVYLCDTFAGVVKAGTEDSDYRGGEHRDTDTSIVEELARSLGVKNTKTLVGIFPDQTGAQLQSERVRLLHIDVDVYQSARDCVEYVLPRMPSGGVIVFDDYGFVGCDGVTRCVDELRARDDLTYVHNINGHALLIKR